MYAYVGSRTTRERNARGEGISVYKVDGRSLSRVQLLSDLVNPSYLVISADGGQLYAVHGDRDQVSAFRVDQADGTLSFLNGQCTEGLNPVHLAIDLAGRHLVVTNHIGASVVVLPIDTDGSLLPVMQRVVFDGPLGPHRVEQAQAKPHFDAFDPTGRWVIVPDKGLDRVFAFRFEHGRLTPATSAFVQARQGAGPRTVAFHPVRPQAYVANELDSTVTAYDFDAATGVLSAFQVLSTLPSSFTGDSRAAGIAIDAAGRTLYVSNRGRDSIAAFRIDADDGALAFLGDTSSGGATPRFFTLSPDGTTLFALNEDSDGIEAFAVDPADGRLRATGRVADCGSPVCMVFSLRLRHDDRIEPLCPDRLR